MRSQFRVLPQVLSRTAFLLATAFCALTAHAASNTNQSDIDHAHAVEVTRYIEENFSLPGRSLYAHSIEDHSPDMSWGNGIQLTNLVAATRYDPDHYEPLLKNFARAMDAYWDKPAKLHGYEPAPTAGNGHDKYYDDNEWIAIAFVEAYETTGDSHYVTRARQTLDFVLSGWDDAAGGLWWHEGHIGHAKNTCSNGPGAVACLRMARHEAPAMAAKDIAWAERIVDWTNQHLQGADGLFWDHVDISTGKIDRDLLTYNTALMIRANLGLWRATGQPRYRDEAGRLSRASAWFFDSKTGVYRDAPKWSHLMAEADFEVGRTLNDTTAPRRARSYANAEYARWKAHPPKELIENASIARLLWLTLDSETPTGKTFWKRADEPH